MNIRKVILHAYRQERARAFAWASADCLQWCGLVTERLTGRDPGAALRARYSSEIEARRIMVKEGWRDMGDVAAALVPEIPLAQARDGDWVQCVDDHGNDGLGVVCAGMAAVRSEGGLGQVPMACARRAFRP